MAVTSSASLLSSLGAYWRGSGGATSCGGDAVLEEEADDASAWGAPEDHPLWPRFYSVWGGDGETRELAERKWRDRRVLGRARGRNHTAARCGCGTRARAPPAPKKRAG
jgi:hypothetical protein